MYTLFGFPRFTKYLLCDEMRLRRPETAAELTKFLQAMNWLRTSLPRMAEVVAHLRLFLEELMTGAARRTKRVAKTALFLPPRGRRAG